MTARGGPAGGAAAWCGYPAGRSAWRDVFRCGSSLSLSSSVAARRGGDDDGGRGGGRAHGRGLASRAHPRLCWSWSASESRVADVDLAAHAGVCPVDVGVGAAAAMLRRRKGKRKRKGTAGRFQQRSRFEKSG